MSKNETDDVQTKFVGSDPYIRNIIKVWSGYGPILKFDWVRPSYSDLIQLQYATDETSSDIWNNTLIG